MKCIVCETEGAQRRFGNDSARFDCRRCGSFLLSGPAEATIETKFNEKPLRRSLMSHTLRKMQEPDDTHLRVITDKEDDLPTFWRNERLPTPQQQEDSLVCRERSIVRGDEGRIMTRPSSRPEARRRL